MIYSGYCVKTGLKGRNRRIGCWEAVAITYRQEIVVAESGLGTLEVMRSG